MENCTLIDETKDKAIPIIARYFKGASQVLVPGVAWYPPQHHNNNAYTPCTLGNSSIHKPVFTDMDTHAYFIMSKETSEVSTGRGHVVIKPSGLLF